MYNITKTQEEIVKEEMVEINISANAGIENLKHSTSAGYNLFWFNPRVTPQEFCDLMGNQAYRLFKDHADATAFIMSKDSTYIPLGVPAGYTYEINGGCVTLTYTEPVEEEEIVEITE